MSDIEHIARERYKKLPVGFRKLVLETLLSRINHIPDSAEGQRAFVAKHNPEGADYIGEAVVEKTIAEPLLSKALQNDLVCKVALFHDPQGKLEDHPANLLFLALNCVPASDPDRKIGVNLELGPELLSILSLIMLRSGLTYQLGGMNNTQFCAQYSPGGTELKVTAHCSGANVARIKKTMQEMMEELQPEIEADERARSGYLESLLNKEDKQKPPPFNTK